MTVGHRELNAGCLERLARLADSDGEDERALRLYTAAELEPKRISTPGPADEAERVCLAMAALRNRVSPEVAARASAMATARSIEELIADELALGAEHA